MEVSPSVVAITVRPFIILLYNGEPLSNKLSGRPTGRQGNILQLGEEREGEVFGGDSRPLSQGAPFVQCRNPSHLGIENKVRPSIWTDYLPAWQSKESSLTR